MPRNSSGNYTLAAGNPVVPDTLIETGWANPTLSDLAAAITDSLSRSGSGGMLAPLKFVDGSLATPGIAFLGESSTGLSRPSSGTLKVGILGLEVAAFTAIGLALAGGLTVAGAMTLTGAFTPAGVINLPLGTAPLPSLTFQGDPNTGLYSPGADQIGLATAGVQRLSISPAGNVAANAPSSGITLFLDALTGNRSLQAGAISVGPNRPRIEFNHDDPTGLSTIDFTSSTGIRAGRISVAGVAAIDISGNRNVAIAPPAGGVTLSVNGIAGAGGTVQEIVGSGNVLTAGLNVRNTNAGNAAGAYLYTQSDSVNFIMASFSSAFTGKAGEAWLYTNAAQPVVIGASGAESLRISANRNVTVAAAASGTTLNVAGTFTVNAASGSLGQMNSSGAAGCFMSYGNPGTRGYIGTGGGGIAAGAASDFGLRSEADLILLSAGGAKVMRFDAAGTLFVPNTAAISRPNAGAILGLNGTNTAEGMSITFGTDASDNPNTAWMDVNWATGAANFAWRMSSVDRMFMNQNGAFVINAPAAGTTLSLLGAACLDCLGQAASYNVMTAKASGGQTFVCWVPSGTGAGVGLRWEATSASMLFDWYVPGIGQALFINTNGACVPSPPQNANSSLVPNTAWVQANCLGMTGYLWRDVTASRLFNTDYPAPNYPIMVTVNVSLPNGADARLMVGGILAARASSASSSGSITQSISAVVPANATYRVTVFAGAPGKDAWSELR